MSALPQSQPNAQQPLELFFESCIHNVFAGQLGLYDPPIERYLAGVLTEFTHTDRLYKIRDERGKPIHSVDALIHASDPVHGTATSFDSERRIRKHIGDYTLFLTGMYPESLGKYYRRRHAHDSKVTYKDLVSTGKESYYIVSQFNLYEYEQEAPLFARLSDWFERCTQGLAIVRQEMSRKRMHLLPPPVEG